MCCTPGLILSWKKWDPMQDPHPLVPSTPCNCQYVTMCFPLLLPPYLCCCFASSLREEEEWSPTTDNFMFSFFPSVLLTSHIDHDYRLLVAFLCWQFSFVSLLKTIPLWTWSHLQFSVGKSSDSVFSYLLCKTCGLWGGLGWHFWVDARCSFLYSTPSLSSFHVQCRIWRDGQMLSLQLVVKDFKMSTNLTLCPLQFWWMEK